MGGYLIYQKRFKPVSISQPSPSPVAYDETVYTEASRSANWKTYTNKKYGYTLKYPANYFVRETNDPNGNIGTTTISNYINEDFSNGRKNPDEDDVFLMFITNPEKETNLNEAKSYYIPTNKIEDFVIDEITGFRVGKNGTIVVVSKKKEYDFNLRNVNSKHTSDYNKILSTFKFLDEYIDTSNWKTYFLQSAFELKYPQAWDYYEYKLEKNIDVAYGPKELVNVNRERLDNPNVAALIGGKAWPVEIKSFNGNLYLYGPNEISFISDAQKKVISKEVIINGINAVKHAIEFYYDAPYINKGDIIEVVIIKQGTGFYSISLSDQKYKDIFNQILSTFKFLP